MLVSRLTSSVSLIIHRLWGDHCKTYLNTGYRNQIFGRSVMGAGFTREDLDGYNVCPTVHWENHNLCEVTFLGQSLVFLGLGEFLTCLSDYCLPRKKPLS